MQDALKQLLWGCSRPFREVLGAYSGVIGCVLDALEGLSQTSWALLSLVGMSWEVLGQLPGNIQDLLEACVDTFGFSWSVMGDSCGPSNLLGHLLGGI